MTDPDCICRDCAYSQIVEGRISDLILRCHYNDEVMTLPFPPTKCNQHRRRTLPIEANVPQLRTLNGCLERYEHIKDKGYQWVPVYPLGREGE